MFEFFISKRYLRSKHKINLISIISLISTIGITIGVAALIVVISVFNGFGSLVKSILINFDPHVSIHAVADTSPELIKEIGAFLNSSDKVESYYYIIEGKVLIQNGRHYQALSLKGITEQDTSRSWGIKTALLKGDINFDNTSDFTPELLVSQRMAIRLSCSVGDTIYISSFENLKNLAIDITHVPQIMPFIVSGLFATDNKDYDVIYAFTAFSSAGKLFGSKGRLNGIEVRLKDIDNSNDFKAELMSRFDTGNLIINSWYDLHKDLYNVMQIERWSAFILLSLIISVATFNILGSLTMSVIEKKRDIGVLRSMGVRIRSVIKIFMLEGLLIGLIGSVLGLFLGLAICYLQVEYKLYALDPSKYIIDAIPVKVYFSDIAAVFTASFLLTFFASLYPARRAAKLNLIESIKYE